MEAEVLENVWWQNVLFRTVSIPGLGIVVTTGIKPRS